MLVTICTEINNRFSRILHLVDQKFVLNIANGTSSMFHNNLISCLYTNFSISNNYTDKEATFGQGLDSVKTLSMKDVKYKVKPGLEHV